MISVISILHFNTAYALRYCTGNILH